MDAEKAALVGGICSGAASESLHLAQDPEGRGAELEEVQETAEQGKPRETNGLC